MLGCSLGTPNNTGRSPGGIQTGMRKMALMSSTKLPVDLRTGLWTASVTVAKTWGQDKWCLHTVDTRLGIGETAGRSRNARVPIDGELSVPKT